MCSLAQTNLEASFHENVIVSKISLTKLVCWKILLHGKWLKPNTKEIAVYSGLKNLMHFINDAFAVSRMLIQRQ